MSLGYVSTYSMLFLDLPAMANAAQPEAVNAVQEAVSEGPHGLVSYIFCVVMICYLQGFYVS